MIEAHGWFFPEGERHLPEWMVKARQVRDGRLQYQFSKYQAALQWVKKRRTAIDVGAHIGQWSHNMSLDFEQVFSFEPVPRYAECWHRNLFLRTNARLEECALGDATGSVSLRAGTPGSMGDTFVDAKERANAAQDVPLRTLDSFGLASVDFLKVDCEGYEWFVIKGGEQTIRKNKPCVIVEQKPRMAQKYGLDETEAVSLLQSWGAKLRAELAGDYILSW